MIFAFFVVILQRIMQLMANIEGLHTLTQTLEMDNSWIGWTESKLTILEECTLTKVSTQTSKDKSINW